jgi:hypothetical protein
MGMKSATHACIFVSFSLGTALFMSPEMIAAGTGSKRQFAGPATDVFSLGVTFYFLVYGQLPWYAKSLPEIYRRIREEPLQFPTGPQWQSLPPPVQHLLRGMLEKDPKKRVTVTRMLQCPWVSDEGSWCPMANLIAQNGTAVAGFKELPPICDTLCQKDLAQALGESKQRPLETLPSPLPVPATSTAAAADLNVPLTFAGKLRARLSAWQREMSRKCEAQKAAKAKKRATALDLKAALAKANAEKLASTPAPAVQRTSGGSPTTCPLKALVSHLSA